MNRKVHYSRTFLCIAIVSIVVCVALFGLISYRAHSYATAASPLTPQVVSAAKVPEGWYQHVVRLEGASSSTIVLTKNVVLPVRNAGDGQYDDPQIIITTEEIPGTPEEYIEQEGLSGKNAEAMGISGTWSTFMGHQMFASDLDHVGDTVTLFGDGTAYSFILDATAPQDATDFWQVITFYARTLR